MLCQRLDRRHHCYLRRFHDQRWPVQRRSTAASVSRIMARSGARRNSALVACARTYAYDHLVGLNAVAYAACARQVLLFNQPESFHTGSATTLDCIAGYGISGISAGVGHLPSITCQGSGWTHSTATCVAVSTTPTTEQDCAAPTQQVSFVFCHPES